MPGNLLLKELSANGTSIYSGGGTVTNGSAFSIATLDLRNAGAANIAQALSAFFQLKWRVATATGIVSGTPLADLFLVPTLDGGTFYATVDITSGAGYISSNHRRGYFSNALASPATATDYRSATDWFDLDPCLYTAYLINRSGQTLTIQDVSYFAVEAQYT